MKRQPGLRLFVVSDPDDKAVSFRSQREFVEQVKARGLPIVHITAAARDKQSHSLHAHGIRLAVDCAKGADDLELAARYQTKIDCAAMRDALKLPADLPCERVLMINLSISRPMP